MNIVIVGHVDHGKSTIIGRLMAETDSLPEGKMDAIREKCRRQSRQFEYAYLLDALKDEQEQGITIDTARCFFKTNKRKYLIMDAPGHVEFLKNMVTGASSAEAALLVVDAKEGIKENTKRHGYILSLLGVRQIVVLVNKMDMVGYSEEAYLAIKAQLGEYLSKVGVEPLTYIPVSGLQGDNIVHSSNCMPWYGGDNLLDVMDSLNEIENNLDKPFRMPVQDVYKFTANGDQRRIIAGTILGGKLKCGDEICFLPSGKKSIVKSIESFNSNKDIVYAGEACGFTIMDELYIPRGEMVFQNSSDNPVCGKSFVVKMFWLGSRPLTVGRKYILKTGHAKVNLVVKEIMKLIDASTLEEKTNVCEIEKNHICLCCISVDRDIAVDLAPWETSRFVIVDDYEISGGGYILSLGAELIENKNDYTPELCGDVYIPLTSSYDQTRNAKYIVIHGDSQSHNIYLASLVESVLIDQGNLAIIIDADLSSGHKKLRTAIKVAELLYKSGVIVIVLDSTGGRTEGIASKIESSAIIHIEANEFSDGLLSANNGSWTTNNSQLIEEKIKRMFG